MESMDVPSMNQGWTYHNRIKPDEAGTTVLDYYTQRYRHSSRAEWKARIASGQILVNGEKTQADTLLRIGQCLTYERPPWKEPSVSLTFAVLYEDAELLVVAKPSGLPVLPGGGFLEHTLLWQVQQRYASDSPAKKPVPIHRLGRGTSGLVLIARTHQARAHLSRQMRQRQIQKFYRALIAPSDLPQQFTITQPIGKVAHPLLGDVYGAVSSASTGGLFAQSECRVLNRDTHSTLLEVKILTGRPHQIRIHVASIGYPLLGDPLYGVGGLPTLMPGCTTMAVPGDCGYYLHAYRLILKHPITGQLLDLKCPPPVDELACQNEAGERSKDQRDNCVPTPLAQEHPRS